MIDEWVFATSPSSLDVAEFTRFVHPGTGEVFGTPGPDALGARPCVRGILDRLMALDLGYRTDPSPVGPVQDGPSARPLRDPASVLAQGAGTSVELSAVLAGCLIAAEVRSWVTFATMPGGQLRAFVVADVSQNVRWDENGVEAGVPVLPVPWSPERDPRAAQWLERVRDGDELWILDSARLGLGHHDPGPVHRDDPEAFLDTFDDVAACDLAAWRPSDCVSFPLPGLPWLDALPAEPDGEVAPAPGGPDDPTPADRSIAWLSLARNQVVPFKRSPAFDELLTRTTDWVEHGNADEHLAGRGLVGWLSITGQGGTGTTRMGLEVLRHIRSDREAAAGSFGWLHAGATEQTRLTPDTIASMMQRAGTVGVLVDDITALSRHDLAELATRALWRPAGWGPVVLVVTAPTATIWPDILADAFGPPLATVELSQTDRRDLVDPQQLFIRCASRFAGILGHDGPTPDAPAKVREMSPLETTMSAALALLGEKPGDPSRTYDVVLEREHARWERLCELDPDPNLRAELDEVLALVCLCRPYRNMSLHGEHIYSVRSDEILTRFFTDDSDRFVPLRPDPLADRLIRAAFATRPDRLWKVLVRVLRDPDLLEAFLVTVDRVWDADTAPEWLDELLDRLLVDGDAAVTSTCLSVLARCRDGYVGRWVIGALDGGRDGDALATAIVTEEDSGHLPPAPLIAAAGHLLAADREPVVRARALAALACAHEAAGDTRRAIDRGDQAIRSLHPLADADATYRLELVEAMHRQALRLEGDPATFDDAVALHDEVIGLFRSVARADPGRQLDLALALGHHANRIAGESGRFDDALSLGEEAISALRQFPEADPRIPVELARIAIDHAVRLTEVPGRFGEAIDLGDEAVRIMRTEAEADPRNLGDLAGALGNQATWLSTVPDRVDEAVDAGDETVDIYEALALDDDRFLPRLADALSAQAERLAEVAGRPEEGVLLGEEALRIHRSLVDENLDWLPRLGAAVHDQAVLVDRLADRAPDAIAFGDEAIHILRPVADGDRRQLPQLALVVDAQARRLDAVPQRRREAFELGREAVRINRVLAGNDNRYLPALAGALAAQANRVEQIDGRFADAVDLADEAILIHRALAEIDDRHLDAFETTLTVHAFRLEGARGNLARAVEVGAEAVRVARRIAQIDRAKLVRLAADLTSQANRLQRMMGGRDTAVEMGDEAVGVYRIVVASDPSQAFAFSRLLQAQAARLDTVPPRAGDAVALGDEVVPIARRLAGIDARYRPALATCLDEQANRLVRLPDRVSEGVRLGDELIGLCRPMAGHGPAYLSKLGEYLNGQAIRVGDAAGRHADAARLGEEAIGVFQQLARDDETYRTHLAWVMDTQAHWLDALKDRRGAKALRGAAANLRR